MDWKALIDIGLGAIALTMVKKLSVTVSLLTELVKGHDGSLAAHNVRLVRVEDHVGLATAA